jgi:hypothetical protein
MIQMLYPVTDDKANTLRANLLAAGVNGARVRKCPNGSARLVLASANDRDAARDALVLSNACTGSGKSFADPSSRHAWNGPVEIFIRFLSA